MGEVEYSGGDFGKFVVAGAIAGTAEHCGMFPLDTIKTHVQAARPNGEFLALRQSIGFIVRGSGYGGFFRGISAVVGGAAPAHAVYFSTYEFVKQRLGVSRRHDDHQPVATAAAGIAATTLSDLIMVPMETIKQRMQLNMRPYKSVPHCIKTVLRNEGVFAFWAGYTTTLTMNLPYAGMWFASYESLCKLIYSRQGQPPLNEAGEPEYDPTVHLLAGGGAGVCASAFTNPFDVAKTRLQTQGDVGKTYSGMVDALTTIWREEGIYGYMRGVRPRMVFHATSGAICWSVYEFVKQWIGD